MEVYGGLGTTEGFARGDERHYVAPVVGWHVTPRTTLKASVAVGLTGNSDRYLLRFGFGYELPIGGR
jgi:hypothetical protein